MQALFIIACIVLPVLILSAVAFFFDFFTYPSQMSLWLKVFICVAITCFLLVLVYLMFRWFPTIDWPSDSDHCVGTKYIEVGEGDNQQWFCVPLEGNYRG